MIPLQLQIKNFLSYGDTVQTIDFAPYSFICLSGKNGHGKSALLDAITWGIWGQARKVAGAAKSDASLVRLGQNHMLVIIDFAVGAHTYRIKREYIAHATKPQAILEFGVLDPIKQQYVSLTDKTIRLTQTKIESIIKIDYDTFINSAFLRQGSSNEFSKKTAKERKDILATILGIADFEQVRKRAVQKTKELQGAHATTSALKAHCMSLTNNSISLQEALREAQHAVQEQEASIAHVEQMLAVYKKASALLSQACTRNAGTEETLTTLKHAFNESHCILTNALNCRKKLSYRSQLYAAYHHQQTLCKALETQINDCVNQLQQKNVAQTRLHQLTTALEKRQREITALYEHTIHTAHQDSIGYQQDYMLAQQRFSSLETAVKTLEAEHAKTNNEIYDQQNALILLHAHMADTKQQVNLYNRRSEARRHYQLRLEQTEITARQIETQIALMKNAHRTCPLCHQHLEQDACHELEKQLIKQYTRVNRLLYRYRMVITTLNQCLEKTHTIVNTLEAKTQAYVIAKTVIDQKTQRLSEYQTALATEKKALISADQQLTDAKQKYDASIRALQDLKNALQNAIAQDTQLNTIAQEHTTAMHLLQSLEHIATTYDHILQEKNNAITLLQAHEHALKEWQFSMHKARQEILAACRQHRHIKNRLNVLSATQHEENYLLLPMTLAYKKAEADAHIQLKTLSQEKDVWIREVGRLHHAVQLCALQKEQEQIYDQQLTTLEADIKDYLTITHAFSKDGIPALLIEQAIPEIEYETNRLLKKLTHNHSYVIIDSLKDLKSGKAKETLDIKIADAAGIRPYELFSGGEAFRIDFALRIALAKLLTQRAGTTLSTLIIDEGFGSQDEDGLSAIMDCLYKIQDDFAKIIIVSHLPSMKDQFPVHFLVAKGPSGSIVRPMEQG